MFDPAASNGTPLTSSMSEITWYFRLVNDSYTLIFHVFIYVTLHKSDCNLYAGYLTARA